MEGSGPGARSPYVDYSAGYKAKLVSELAPTPASFLRKYVLASAPFLVYLFLGLSHLYLFQGIRFNHPSDVLAVPRLLANLGEAGAAVNVLALAAISAVAVVSWVLRSAEAFSSSILALVIPLLLNVVLGGGPATWSLQDAGGLWTAYVNRLGESAALAALLTVTATELRRRSIKYVLTDLGVTLKGGLIRLQEHSIPYSSIGRLVLEQGVLGRLLNYGNVILVSPSEWGSEYYTRMVGAGAEVGKASIEAGYARTLKEVSRDPLKCIYGVKDPRRVKETLEYMVQAPYRAELDQARYLKELRDRFKAG